MKQGDIYQHKRKEGGPPHNGAESRVVQIIKTWNKRDIDPDCPESVAIIPMVQFIVWSDGQEGGTFNCQRGSFNRQYTRAEVTQ